jgi:hypothetical protein
MSWAFRVAKGGDVWSDDYQHRRITRITAIFDVSAVGEPASPTTSISVVAAPPQLQPDQRAQAEARLVLCASEIQRALDEAEEERARDARAATAVRTQHCLLKDDMFILRSEGDALRAKHGIPKTKRRRTPAEKERDRTLKMYSALAKNR